ncbi:MAG: hypothetical protein WB507_09145 [Solirubrobacterales bacterium]
MRRAIRGLSVANVVAVVAATLLLGAPAAQADAPIVSFSVTPSTTQAGGHPDLDTFLEIGNRDTQSIPPPNCRCQDAKNITFQYPAGLTGDPHATPQCSAADFATLQCPVDSQVGVEELGVSSETYANRANSRLENTGVYDLVPHPGQAGLLGFNVPIFNFAVFIELSPRTQSDYGLTATITDITHAYPVSYTNLDLWGVPADSSHDGERYGPVGCLPKRSPQCQEPYPSNSPHTPFLDNPTSCGVPLATSVEVLAYDDGVSRAESAFPPTTGCDQLSFDPSLFAQPTSTATDSPSGLEANLLVPQQSSPTVPSPSEIKEATVTLPPGFSVNPGAADGKTSCTDAQARLGTQEEAQCPESATVGSLTIESSALPGPLPGYVYLGQPQPGNRYRVILAADGFGVHVKLAGTATPDPQTGQLTVSLSDLPQSPFSDFNIHLFGSERGLLATPTQCGTYPVTSTFKPWDAFLPEQTSVQYFTLDSGPDGTPCPPQNRPFSPSFEASSLNSAPGIHSPLTIDFGRADGDQNLAGLTLSTPPGLLATLRGVPYCSDAALSAAAGPSYSGLAEQENPSCPAGSLIGVSDSGAGAGTHPVYFPGKVYLAGPYKGAPLSLAVITPAVSGPYDLGNVVFRAALQVNPETAQITAVSDPLPLIREGIPLRLRSVLLELNRPGFTLNPTNCDPFSVSAKISGDQGAQANLSSHFQVANCADLGFAPRLTTRLTGSTKQAGNPSLHAVLTYPQGGTDANIARTTVTLPHTELLAQAHISDPCLRAQFTEGHSLGERCPSGSAIGLAKAESPLLEKPLEGPVYLRASGRRLPDVVAALNGQIDIALVGHVESVPGKLSTTFETVPDAPISHFSLTLDGGSRGLLENSPGLCSATQHVTVQMTAQNGKTANQNPVLQTPCHKKHHKRATAHRNRRASR